jgi:pimeloyl-ACP methyl ester carboxylesterase
LRTRTKVWKVFRWSLLLIVGLALVFFLVVVPWFFAGIITASRFHFRDPNDGKTPQAWGMEYQPVEFRAPDGVRLIGWYLPASGPARGTIVYAHGQNRTRIEMLPMAAFAHGLGYNGLVFDLRHQGASGGDIGSVGYWERLDVEGAAHFALTQQHAPRPMVAWGISMGAAATLLATADSPEIDAVISDSSFINFDDLVRHHWRLFIPLPSFPMVDEVITWTAWRAHFRPADFDLVQAVRRIGDRPILFIGVQDDRRMPPAYARTLGAAAASPLSRVVIVPGTKHGEGFFSGQAQYEQAVKEFLNAVSKERAQPAAAPPAGP